MSNGHDGTLEGGRGCPGATSTLGCPPEKHKRQNSSRDLTPRTPSPQSRQKWHPCASPLLPSASLLLLPLALARRGLAGLPSRAPLPTSRSGASTPARVLSASSHSRRCATGGRLGLTGQLLKKQDHLVGPLCPALRGLPARHRDVHEDSRDLPGCEVMAPLRRDESFWSTCQFRRIGPRLTFWRAPAQLLVGRLAMMGFASGVTNELVTGHPILQQVCAVGVLHTLGECAGV